MTMGRFVLTVAGVEHGLDVVRLRGRERLSGLYRYELDLVTSRRVAADQRALLGRAASLAIGRPDGTHRSVHGVLVAQRVDGRPAPGDLRRLHVTLVPRMWLLRHRERSRVFHRMNPVAVVVTVLREHHIEVEARVMGRHALLEHCVQHRESDLAFVERILARHGIAWWFRHPDEVAEEGDGDGTSADLGGVTVAFDRPDEGADALQLRERVVLCDRPEGYDALGEATTPRALSFADAHDDASQGDHGVRSFSAEGRVRPTSGRVTRYDPARFHPFEPHDPTERADLRAGRRERATAEESLGLELDTHEAEHAAIDSQSAARVLLERARGGATRCFAESVERDLRPGARFRLQGHPYAELNRDYVVTEVTHRGELPETREGDAAAESTYDNRFVCVPAGVMVRPRYARPAPRQVVESATVVGLSPDDVFNDGVGRIKLRFHWDRRSLASEDERCCFVRKTEAWAASGWGTSFTPRPGMEVLVAFLDGDPDQPVVLGSLYNETNAPPFPTDASSRRSGLRTRTVGGEGYNELSFEDLVGREEVFVRAQRDLRATVLRDLDLHVGHDLRSTVEGSVSAGVRGSSELVVDGDHAVSVGRDLIEELRGNRRSFVAGTLQSDVAGHHASVVARDRTASIGGDLSVAVTGAASLNVDGPGGATLESVGALTVNGRDHVQIEATEGLTLRCGDARITLTHDRIELSAPHVVVRGDDSARVEGGAGSIEVDDRTRIRADSVSIRSNGAALRLSREAELMGAKVHLGRGDLHAREHERPMGSSDDAPRVLSITTLARNPPGTPPVGILRILDGAGDTVRVVPASDGREEDAMLFFTFPVESLPDPVEIVYELGDYREHLLGPVSPARVHERLVRRRAVELAGGVARARHRGVRGTGGGRR